MRGNNEEKASPKESLRQLQKKINTISRRVDAFSSRLEGMSSITSPERKQNYESCDKLKAEIELISKELSCLPKANQDVSLEAFTEQKKKAKLRLDSLKSQLDRISEQLEPDEVEEDYFRKMQAGEVGASTSDILTDKADDDANPGRDTDSGDEEDENDDEQDEDSEEESTANIVMVRKVRTLSDFDGEQDGDLSFKKGEILTVIKTTEDGWWDAENEAGKQGVVPKTLVEIIHEEETPSPRQQPEEEPSAISRETRDKVPEMSRTRSGMELWKTLQQTSRQETSATDVLKAMGAMPSGFRSTTLGRLAKQEQFQTSSWLMPKLSRSNVAFRDITWDPVAKQLRPRAAKTNRVFQVMSARMVPFPGTGIEIISRHVRIVIWDIANNQPLSNVHSVRGLTTEKDPMTWNFNPKCPSSVFDSECLARINSNDDSLVILFELNMLYKRTSTNEKSEVACGWCILKLFEENGSPVPNKTYEIPLNGGTPFDIGVDLDPSVSLKASTNRFQQVVRTNRQPRLTVKLISYQRKEIMLPDTLLTCHVYTQFICLYRQLLTEAIMDEGRDSQDAGFIMDPIISTFPKIIYTADVMDALKRCWDEKNRRDLKRSQRRDGAVLRRLFRDVYMDSVFPILNSAELPPYIWGNDEREKERLTLILTYWDKRTAWDNLLAPNRLYKPFNVDRFTLDLSNLQET
ncbi:nephrocystin-1-like isoform X2 [Acropora palmata]|uniref:nephrocystin-1-like isoform X2 n=1 Tax=Acropora palmata TaxID=6131 RepID=UPI003DA14024